MKSLTGVLIVFLSITVSGCAHGEIERNLDEKLARETSVKHRADLKVEARNLIDNAPGLTDNQRKELGELLKSTGVESDQIQERSFRLQAVLVKELLKSNYNSDEVDVVKSKMKDLEHERLHLFFTAIRNVNTLLGRWRPLRQQNDELFYDQMMLMSDPRNF